MVYSFYLPALASAMASTGKFNITDIVERMLVLIESLTENRASDFMFSSFTSFLFSMMVPGCMTNEQLWKLCPKVMDTGRFTSIYPIFSQLI